MKSYEVRVYRDGAWKLYSAHDSRDDAIDDARTVDASGRFPAVSVVEETHDSVTNEIKARTIFRDSAFERANQERLEHSRQERLEHRVVENERTMRRREQLLTKIQKKRRDARARLAFLTIITIFCGIMSLAGLQYLREVLWDML